MSSHLEVKHLVCEKSSDLRVTAKSVSKGAICGEQSGIGREHANRSNIGLRIELFLRSRAGTGVAIYIRAGKGKGAATGTNSE